jgi:hypothetical protein
MKMILERLATTVRLSLSSTTVGAASSDAPASRVVSVVVVEVGLLPPSGGLAQEGPARWRNGGRLLVNGG